MIGRFVTAPGVRDGGSFDAPGGPTAALCLHGLTSSPFELLPVAQTLAEAGVRVAAPRLIGHGESAELLQHTRWIDWLTAARRACDRLLESCDQIFVVGLSMGALLAIVLAHERGTRVAGLVVMGTPLELGWKAQLFLRLANRLPLTDALPHLVRHQGPDVSDPGVAAAMPGTDRIPVGTALSLLEGQRAAKDRCPRLGVPVLVQHGRHDHTAPVSNAYDVMRRLRTPHRRLIIYPKSWHILPLDVEHEQVAADVLAFVRDPTGSRRRA